MSDDLELVRGSGNAFRDFGYADADAEVEHLKAVLAAQIIRVLDDAHGGLLPADVSQDFYVDALVTHLARHSGASNGSLQ